MSTSIAYKHVSSHLSHFDTGTIKKLSKSLQRVLNHWNSIGPTRTVFGMLGYFLLLSSVAVVYISHQFPWFMLPPVTLLLIIGYLRISQGK